jgi:sulfur-carrier protein adenylyltransferase/sulfurtransferase
VYDALALSFQEFRFARRADCAVCGDVPRITTLTPTEEPDLATIEEWSPATLAQTLQSADAGRYVLVDVREPYEWAAGRIPGSLHIPLGSLPGRFEEIPADRDVVFICAAGARSMAACRFAAQAGRGAINLEGGLYAWSAEFGPPPAP